MRTWFSMAASICALLVTAGCLEATPIGAQKTPALNGRRVALTATDFGFDPETIKAEPGERITIVLSNRGRQKHSMRVLLPRAEVALDHELGPGEIGAIDVRVPEGPGRFELFCPVGDHRDRGMRAMLVAEPARQPQASRSNTRIR